MKIISFSLWGSDKLYSKGVQPNIELAKEIFPDWIIRIHIDQDVTQEIKDLVISTGNQIVPIDNIRSFWHGLFWRFYPAGDNSIERFICRDLDSRLNVREKAAVDEWIASGKSVHVMRDHKHHGYPMPGGMWGCTGGFISDIKKLVHNWADINSKGCDQRFLAKVVWPRVKDSSIAHDEFFKGRFGGIWRPFPKHPHFDGHVGQIVR